MRLLRYASVAFAATLLAPTLASADPDDEIEIANDSPSPDTFTGYGDSGQVIDPSPTYGSVGQVYYMAYTYPSEEMSYKSGTGYIYDTFATSVHFAYSSDSGDSWTKPIPLPALWPWSYLSDPGGSGDIGFLNYETPSLAVHEEGGQTRWFGSRLAYYQNAEHYYNPDFAEHWVIEVVSRNGADPSVLNAAALTSDDITRIGVNNTDDAWLDPDDDTDLTNVDAVIGVHCGILNNPAIYWSELADRLVLVTECIGGSEGVTDWNQSGIIVLSTTAEGDPVDWDWEFNGVLANKSVADNVLQNQPQITALGVTQPYITKGPTSGEVALMSIVIEAENYLGYVSIGCVALQIDTLFPELPELDPEAEDPNENGRYDADYMLTRVGGNVVVKNWIPGAGSCNYAGSTTGIVYNTVEDDVEFHLVRSEVHVP